MKRSIVLTKKQIAFLVCVLDDEWPGVSWDLFSESANRTRRELLNKVRPVKP